MKKTTILFLSFILSLNSIAQTDIDFESGTVNDYFDYDTNLFSVELKSNFEPYLNPSANISEIRYQSAATGNDAITLKVNPVNQSHNGVITFQINIASPFISPATVWLYNDAIGTSSRIEMNNITLNAWNEWFTANVGVADMDQIGPQYTNYNRLKIFLQKGTDQGTLLFALDNVQVQPHLLSTTDFEDVKFNFFPNPASESIQFESKKIIESVKLTNVVGKEVLSMTINAKKGKLDVLSLQSGLYFLEVNAQGKKKTIKIIKD
ncbi:T9SS type A sorting domain-containing protein [Pontimicrobium aquaticum]|uniref:T9SS type A sorting domain-containing protein n=1 Tax=Pontimicrobium aquaticum TaxID=2565367 RepID=A0A4U0EYB0_9FLAO|nr:T9SS type A sorting domain-containing protein [Pontimicrobium aquaticum]TJY37061.1 T9SS type A sorting domain-containing protein [Pontimicrobium aquaticum]